MGTYDGSVVKPNQGVGDKHPRGERACPPRSPLPTVFERKSFAQHLFVFSVLLQAAAGFYTWMVVLNDYGFPPHILLGLGRGEYFGAQPLMCVIRLDWSIDAIRLTQMGPRVDLLCVLITYPSVRRAVSST